MTRLFRSLPGLALLLILVGGAPLVAAVPDTIAHQGLVRDAEGARISGTHTFDFAVFAAASGGSPLWQETIDLPVARGLYHHALGSVTGFPDHLFADSGRWLQVTVDGDVQSPRQHLTSVPYAMTAGRVAAGGVDSATLQPGAVTPLAHASGHMGFFDSAQPPTGYVATGLRIDANGWQDRTSLSSLDRTGMAATVHDGILYVAGGFRRSGIDNIRQDTMERYVIAEDRWLGSISLPHELGSSSALTHGDAIYLIGGTDDSGLLASVHRYTPATGQWDRIADLPDALFFVRVGVVDGAIHAVAGAGEAGVGSTAHWRYDASADTWTVRAALPEPVLNAASAARGTSFHLVGGFLSGVSGDYRKHWHYDATADTWTENAPLPVRKIFAQAAFLDDGQLYVVGGHAGTESADTLIYDPVSDSWQFGARLAQPRTSIAVAADGNTLFCVGGYAAYVMHGPAESRTTIRFANLEAWTPRPVFIHRRQP